MAPFRCARMRRSRLTVFIPFLLAALLAGCATPSEKAFRFARQSGLDPEIVQGAGFRHVVFRNQVPAARVMRVYLEGDGTPYVDRLTVAADPTPSNPLVLRLMAQDTEAAVYVGRPCYFGLANDAGCSPSFWTLRRYSPEVISSLVAVIRDQQAARNASALELVGHSGGGALAILLARELPSVERIITLAGNLDTDAWVGYHRYEPLVGSVNPRSVQLPSALADRTVHFVGGKDAVVPMSISLAAARQIGGSVVTRPTYSHRCCWERDWPLVLGGRAPF